jgi:hypothetical protein
VRIAASAGKSSVWEATSRSEMCAVIERFGLTYFYAHVRVTEVRLRDALVELVLGA